MADLEETPEQLEEESPAEELETSEEPEEQPAEETPPASESPASVIVSAASAPADQLQMQLQLMRDNLELVQKRLDNHGSLLGAATERLDLTRLEMTDTIQLFQQMLGEHEQHLDGLGLIADALTKMHQQLMKALNRQ